MWKRMGDVLKSVMQDLRALAAQPPAINFFKSGSWPLLLTLIYSETFQKRLAPKLKLVSCTLLYNLYSKTKIFHLIQAPKILPLKIFEQRCK